MLTLDPEDALVALVLNPGPMLQFRQRSHRGKAINAMRKSLGAKLRLPRHGLYHIGNPTGNQAREVDIAMQEEGWIKKEEERPISQGREREGESFDPSKKGNRRKKKRIEQVGWMIMKPAFSRQRQTLLT